MRWRLFVLFAAAFAGVYGSANLVASMHGWRWPMAAPNWPFWPEWSWVYLSLDLLLPVAFWRVSAFRLGAFTSALLLATVLAWPCFLLFPLPAIPLPSSELNPAFRLADTLNLEANYFPSLHVAYAAIASVFLGRAAWLWGALIAFSTLVTHQHYTIDVLAGLVLAALCCRWARGAGHLEAICLEEVARCATRHRRYALIGAALLGASVPHWKRRRLARVGFCYLQHLDDLLDGHLASPLEPEEVASSHQRALRGEAAFEDTPLGRLGACLAEELRAREGEKGVALAVAVIEEMKLDRRRVRDRLLLDEGELDRHLERTFELSLDLMLIASDSPLRATQLPHLVKSLGWCSVVRDYQEDQSLGLINVPREVWLSGKVDPWFARRHAEVVRHLSEARQELSRLGEQKGARLLGLFLRSVEGYAAREGTARAPRNG